MFHEWAAAGMAAGVKGFFAVLFFALCVGIMVGVVALVTWVMGGNDK